MIVWLFYIIATRIYKTHCMSRVFLWMHSLSATTLLQSGLVSKWFYVASEYVQYIRVWSSWKGYGRAIVDLCVDKSAPSGRAIVDLCVGKSAPSVSSRYLIFKLLLFLLKFFSPLICEPICLLLSTHQDRVQDRGESRYEVWNRKGHGCQSLRCRFQDTIFICGR